MGAIILVPLLVKALLAAALLRFAADLVANKDISYIRAVGIVLLTDLFAVGLFLAFMNPFAGVAFLALAFLLQAIITKMMIKDSFGKSLAITGLYWGIILVLGLLFVGLLHANDAL